MDLSWVLSQYIAGGGRGGGSCEDDSEVITKVFTHVSAGPCVYMCVCGVVCMDPQIAGLSPGFSHFCQF